MDIYNKIVQDGTINRIWPGSNMARNIIPTLNNPSSVTLLILL
jgi:hypothetical protein